MSARVRGVVVASIIVVVIAVVVAGLAYDKRRQASVVETTGTRYTLVSGAVLELTARLDTPVDPRAVFFGDSYTAGEGASSASDAYPAQASTRLGWDHLDISKGGSGYTNAGRGGGTYATRLQNIVNDVGTFDPNIFVLQGGFNDQNADAVALAAQIDADVSTVRANYPAAQVVIFGPVAPTAETRPAIAEVNDQLALKAEQFDIPFVDGIDFLLDSAQPGLIAKDEVHPTDAGHAVLANRFAESIG